MKEKMPASVLIAAEKLKTAGFQAWVVGGAVRDILLGRIPPDFDMATDAHPEDMLKVFPRVIPTGIKHGTVTIPGDPFIEITTFRRDGVYEDARRPKTVEWTKSIEEDLARRDFTMGAMAYEIDSNTFLDPYGGLKDLKRGRLRAVGEPVIRFREDALRMMRAARFASTHLFRPGKEILVAIQENSDLIKMVAWERIGDEFRKLMAGRRPSLGIEILRRGNLLSHVLPELNDAYGVPQNEYHLFDVYWHTLIATDEAPAGNLAVRFGALLHDIAKPLTRVVREDQSGHATFYNHEVLGVKLTRRILRRLCYGKDFAHQVLDLVRHHMFHYTDEWTDSAVRRFLKKVGPTMLPDLFLLREADRAGNGKRAAESRSITDLKAHIERVMNDDTALSIDHLAIGGQEIMDELGLSPGPAIGKLLNAALDAVIEDPDLNNRDKLVEFIRSKSKGS